MEDTQNSAPDALEASKLNPSAQRNDTQSVTKRFVSALQHSYGYSHSHSHENPALRP